MNCLRPLALAAVALSAACSSSNPSSPSSSSSSSSGIDSGARTDAGRVTSQAKDAGSQPDATGRDASRPMTDSGAPPRADGGPDDAGTSPHLDAGTSPHLDAGLNLIRPITSCTIPTPPAAGTINTGSASYGTIHAPSVNGSSSQTLDIAWPKTTGTLHPLVIAIHGGGWYAGGADAETPALLASLGYTAASLNYRLVATPDGGSPLPDASQAANDFVNTFPADISDVRCALRYLRHNAAKYDIDTSRIGVFGSSAGAHLAALLVLATSEDSFDDGTCDPDLADAGLNVNVAIGFYGPYDLTQTSAFMAMPQATFDLKVIGAELHGDTSPESLAHASPITYVTSHAPPMLLLHGSSDQDIPDGQAPALRNRLWEAGVQATWIEIPNEPHGFPPISEDGGLATSTCTLLGLLQQKLAP